MRTTKITFVLAAALALLGTSGAAIAAQSTRRMVPVSSTIKEMLSKLDTSVRDEIEHGCVESDGRGGTRFCGSSKEKTDRLHDETVSAVDALKSRPAKDRMRALSRIRGFRGNDALALTYVSTAANPYRDDGTNIESYIDNDGNEYWIDPEKDVLVQMGPNSGAHQAALAAGSASKLGVKALREKAVATVEAHVAAFAERRSSLHPLEDNKKGQVYFFRWEDFAAQVKESELPPFVQVGLYADGSLASYTDTLTR